MMMRKLNITLNFMFHMYDKNLYKRDVTCSLHPPLSQTVTPSRSPSPRAWRTLWTAPMLTFPQYLGKRYIYFIWLGLLLGLAFILHHHSLYQNYFCPPPAQGQVSAHAHTHTPTHTYTHPYIHTHTHTHAQYIHTHARTHTTCSLKFLLMPVGMFSG